MDGIKAGKGKRGMREVESEATVYTNQSYIPDMAVIILNAITAKILKLQNGDYPENTTLIVDCALNTIYLKDEWDRLIDLVREKVPANSFSRIFLTADSGYKSVTL